MPDTKGKAASAFPNKYAGSSVGAFRAPDLYRQEVGGSIPPPRTKLEDEQVSEIVGEANLEFFLNTPNNYIKDRKPKELLESDPARLLSLAKAFAHPADVF